MVKSYRVSSQGVVGRYSEALVKLRQPGDYVSLVRGIARAIVMSCPDGCGEILTINLDGRTGPAWRKFEREGKLTIYPSVWRETGCKSHFIVWKDCILWCGVNDDPKVSFRDDVLISKVLTELPTNKYVHYKFIAETLDEIPWDVNWVCRLLVRTGHAAEGKQGTYRKIGENDNFSKPSSGIDIFV